MRIIFGKLNFIVDQIGDLRLYEPERTEWEEEQSLKIQAFTAGLEEAIDGGPHAIACHLTRHAWHFVQPGQEPRLNTTLFLRKIRDSIPKTDMVPDLIHSQTSGVPTHAATTRPIQLLQAITPPFGSPTKDLKNPRNTDRDCNDDNFNSNLVGVTIHNLS